MSFLFPLYLLGIAAVALPVILHLRRRPPKERTEFSSLMFLEASPMERKRRRRLENLLILLLRCGLICLLAFLFARPLFHGEATPGSEGDGKLVVILLDRSASMQREKLWEEAVGKARDAAAKTGAGDRLALLAFDGRQELLVGFDSGDEGKRGSDLVAAQLEGLEAGWGSTDLGGAIAFAVELIEEARNTARSGAGGLGPGESARAEIFLISDLQEGADRGALDTVGWPANTSLVVESMAPVQAGNASLHLLASRNILTLRDDGPAAAQDDEAGESGALRLRLANEATSIADEFRVGWAGREAEADEHILAPGAQRTFPMDVPAGGAVLELKGDAHDFDNRVHVVPEEPRPLRVVYLGGEGEENDTADPYFYLKRAVQATNFHAPVMHREIPEGLGLSEAADFVILAGPVEAKVVADIRRYLEEGGTALALLSSAKQGEQLGELTGQKGLALEEADLESEYVLLEEIQFDDGLLGAFENPRVRDFSKVHFWRYRKLKGGQEWKEGSAVLARFDSGDAAWLSQEVGEGKLVIFTSGWQPADSQLGLSTKFVPLVYSLLESGGAGATGGAQFTVGDGLPVAPDSMILRPDGVEERAGGSGFYGGTDVPGIYRVSGGDGEHAFAVNVDYRESQTEAISLERFEEAGIVISGRAGAGAGGEAAAADPARKRYMLDAEREKRQQLWRWLIFGAIVVVFLEMLLAGRKAQPVEPEAV